MKKAILILVVIALTVSCKKAEVACANCVSFYFENPQPVNDSELDHFPVKFRGLYVNKDSTFVRVEEDRILSEHIFKFKIHKQKLDSIKDDCDIVDGKLIAKNTKDKYEMNFKGDSIELTKKYIDTLFRFSLNQKAKRIDGQLVLSKKDSLFWNVEFVSVENNTIKFRKMFFPEDLKKLDSITEIKGKMLDSTSYLIKPTRSDFKKILKIKKLGFDREYKKVS
jgi:hypothetical protein